MHTHAHALAHTSMGLHVAQDAGVAAGSSPDKLGRFGVLLLEVHSTRRGEPAEDQDEAFSRSILTDFPFSPAQKIGAQARA